ncbi:MAG: hypothetical protein ACTSPY_09475 [Candidatus Helarchaeota archaeon]
MSMGIKFVPMPPDIQERIIKVIRAIERGEIDPEYGASFFMTYFVGRLTIIADNHPKSEKLHQLANGQMFTLIVNSSTNQPLIQHTALIGERLNKFKYKPGIIGKDTPRIIFADVDTFLDVLLNKKEMMQAIAERKLTITKISKLLKWMAPIMALNDEGTQELLESECPKLMSNVLSEIESKLKI